MQTRGKLRFGGSLVALAGLITLRALRRRRRPTAAKLIAMSDRDFRSFVRSVGLRTISTGSTERGRSADRSPAHA